MEQDRGPDDTREVLTRRRVLAAIPAATKAAVSDDPGVDPRVAAFHQSWDKFLRKYLGCPSWATNIKECDLNRGLWDYPEFRKASKLAKELFERKG